MSSSTAFPDDLVNFDQLPSSAHVRKDVAKKILGINSETTLHRAIKEGRVPQPKKITRFPVWNVGELRAKLASLG